MQYKIIRITDSFSLKNYMISLVLISYITIKNMFPSSNPTPHQIHVSLIYHNPHLLRYFMKILLLIVTSVVLSPINLIWNIINYLIVKLFKQNYIILKNVNYIQKINNSRNLMSIQKLIYKKNLVYLNNSKKLFNNKNNYKKQKQKEIQKEIQKHHPKK